MNYLPIISGALMTFCSWLAPSTYTMRGNITGLKTGWVYMYHPADRPTDSAAISDGHFELSGNIDEPEFCHLVFRTVSGGNLNSMGFFLQPGAIEASGNKDTLGGLRFTGAPVQDEYEEFLHLESGLVDWNGWNSAYQAAHAKNNRAKMDSLETRYQELDRRQRQFVRQYAATHPGSYVSVEEILNSYSYNPDADTLQQIFNGLAPKIQSSYLGRELKAILDAALLTGIGRPAPEITEGDPKGKPVTLSSLRGQYVLVDFWASWCGPCRAENPNVLNSYRKFHSQGFTILGVSLDDQKDKWLAAIRQDRLPWRQVSDLKGWNNEAAVRYGVAGIPMNFLLDKNGKIVAKGLRGEGLEKKLADLLLQ